MTASTLRIPLAAIAASAAFALVGAAGCAVTRGQETTGAYIDDASITSQVKGRFAQSPEVAATSIRVETLNGVVMLSGFAKSGAEKMAAESIARKVSGVTSVKNEIAVQP